MTMDAMKLEKLFHEAEVFAEAVAGNLQRGSNGGAILPWWRAFDGGEDIYQRAYEHTGEIDEAICDKVQELLADRQLAFWGVDGDGSAWYVSPAVTCEACCETESADAWENEGGCCPHCQHVQEPEA